MSHLTSLRQLIQRWRQQADEVDKSLILDVNPFGKAKLLRDCANQLDDWQRKIIRELEFSAFDVLVKGRFLVTEKAVRLHRLKQVLGGSDEEA